MQIHVDMGLGRRYADTCGHGAGEEVCRYMWAWGWGGGMQIHVDMGLGRRYADTCGHGDWGEGMQIHVGIGLGRGTWGSGRGKGHMKV